MSWISQLFKKKSTQPIGGLKLSPFKRKPNRYEFECQLKYRDSDAIKTFKAVETGYTKKQAKEKLTKGLFIEVMDGVMLKTKK